MEVIDDIFNNKDVIMESINKYGHAPEHNFWYFLNIENKNEKCKFFDFQDSMGIMARFYGNGSCEMITEILAPEDKKIEIFEEFLNYSLIKKKLKKAFVFVSSGLKRQIRKSAKQGAYCTSRAKVYYCPVFNLKNIDKNLEGRHWKKLRNIRNSFYRENRIEIVPSKEVKKELLRNIFFEWKKNKNSYGRVEYAQYLNFIENNFEGTEQSKTLIINGIPSTVTAGWSIPNTNQYYSAIGVHNYKFKHLGEIENLGDLLDLKSRGYTYVNFGSSDAALLSFKKKFNPEYVYKLHYFSIRK